MVLQAKLKADVTPVGCDACGHVFLAQRPESVVTQEVSSKKGKAKKAAEKAAPATQGAPPPTLSIALLQAADDITSSVVIRHFDGNAQFKKFAKKEIRTSSRATPRTTASSLRASRWR